MDERAPHLTSLSDDFDVWRTFCLRSAGFPVADALGLASPEAARAADAVVLAERAARLRRDEVLSAASRWVDATSAEERGAALRFLKAVRAGRRAEPPAHPATAEANVALGVAQVAAQAAAADLARALDECSARARDALRRFVGDDSVREAITWQNRTLFATAIDRFVADLHRDDKKQRQREQLLATYLQRYTVKNDSIGFFGPVGWGTWADGAGRMLAEDELATRPTAYLEDWAAQELATTVGGLPGARRSLRPRRAPLVRVEGLAVHSPFGTFDVPLLSARVIASCDGARTVEEICDGLALEGHEAGAVIAALDVLSGQELVRCRLDVPTFARRYDDFLHAWAAALPDPDARGAALAQLAGVEDALRRLEGAAGSSAVSVALDELDRAFQSVTGAAVTRAAGEMYAGRTVVHCMSRRRVELALGRHVREALGEPLGLLCRAARWWSSRIAEFVAGHVETIVREARSDSGEDRVSLMNVWPRISAFFPRAQGDWAPGARAITGEYQQTWAELLGVRPGARRIDVRSCDIEAAARRAFEADAPGWPAARCHSPDIMIAAGSFEDVERGECLYVLGEAHLFVNSIEQGVFVREHGNVEELRRDLQSDQPFGRLVPALFAAGGGSTFADHPLDTIVTTDWTLPWQGSDHVVPISDLVVEDIEGAHFVATRDGRRRWSIRSALDAILSNHGLSILPSTPHTPRVTIDRLVVTRETWRFRGADLPFASEATTSRRLVAARELVAQHGLPRFCFFKCSNEVKPCFVDFESPTFIDVMAKQIRGSENVTISEMLPTPDACWLSDGRGRRYTSEIRMVLVDRRPYVRSPHER